MTFEEFLRAETRQNGVFILEIEVADDGAIEFSIHNRNLKTDPNCFVGDFAVEGDKVNLLSHYQGPDAK